MYFWADELNVFKKGYLILSYLIALIYLGSQLSSFKTAQHVHFGCHVSVTNGFSEIF